MNLIKPLSRFNKMNNETNIDLTIKDKLFEFIDLNLRNGFVRIDEIDADIYLRNTKRCINNEMISTIDLANININDNFQNKGYCSKIIQYLIEIAKSKNIQAIYVECVLSDAIEHIIINKFDFVKIKYNDEFQKNYYMYVK